MSSIVYYESSDGNISITDTEIYLFGMTYNIEDLKSGVALVEKPDQTINLAFALLGIVCIILGKLRAGDLLQIVDLNVLFNAANYFDLTGLILILIALLITLPQDKLYYIQVLLNNGNKTKIILTEKKYYTDIVEIDQAIKQALRFKEYKQNIS